MVWKEGDRKGLKVGDRVKPTKEYLEQFSDKDDFEAIIDRWCYDEQLRDIAYLKYTKTNQPYKLTSHWGISTYWIEKL